MKRNRFATYAWSVLGYNVLVILWGGYVRASGSGAGCGSHWPLCNGEVLPRDPQVATLIELAHRISSGLALLLVVGLFFWALRAYQRGHRVRLGAGLSLVFMLSEALIGAGLVLFSLVADNASMARAMFMSAHLANTFLLLAMLTLTAWWASGGAALRVRGQGALAWILSAGWVATLVLGVSGAVTALGDTLFPAGSLAEGLSQDFSPTAHLFVRLRVFHPVIAVAVSLYLIVAATLASSWRPAPRTRLLARAIMVLVVIQLAAGAINVALLAPIWMQIIHLLLADALWVTLVLLSASALATYGAFAPAPPHSTAITGEQAEEYAAPLAKTP